MHENREIKKNIRKMAIQIKTYFLIPAFMLCYTQDDANAEGMYNQNPHLSKLIKINNKKLISFIFNNEIFLSTILKENSPFFLFLFNFLFEDSSIF
jgi:hypothetical protein